MNRNDRPTGTGPLDQDDDPLYEQAAELYLYLQEAEGKNIERANARIIAWIAGDPLREAIVDRVRSAWRLVGDYADEPGIVSARADALAVLRSGARHSDARRSGSRRNERAGQGWRNVALVASLLLLLVPLAYLFPLPTMETAQSEVYRTGLAETRSLVLDDNTRITLDAQTTLTVRYSSRHRDIQLEKGQVHFEVAHDPNRPFRVDLGNRSVVALGTTFNIEKLRRELRVTLVEGRVAVTAAQDTGGADQGGGTDRELSPGQQLVINTDRHGHQQEELHQIDPEHALAWREGKLVFDNETLADAVERMNRYARIKVVIHDDSLRDILINGSFKAGNTDAFVSALVAYFPIETDRSWFDRITLRAARDSAGNP